MTITQLYWSPAPCKALSDDGEDAIINEIHLGMDMKSSRIQFPDYRNWSDGIGDRKPISQQEQSVS